MIKEYSIVRSSMGRVTVSPTASRPPAKAKSWTHPLVRERRMAAAAPTQAPPDTPRKSGEISGF